MVIKHYISSCPILNTYIKEKILMYKSLLVVSLFSLSVYAGEGIKINPIVSHKLGNIELYHHNGNFKVFQNNKVHVVAHHNVVDKQIRSIDSKKLSFFLNHGHIQVSQNNQGDFILRSNVHGLGGGHATGKLFGVITKFGGYAAIGIACLVHKETALHAAELREAVDAAALAAEAVGIALPTP